MAHFSVQWRTKKIAPIRTREDGQSQDRNNVRGCLKSRLPVASVQYPRGMNASPYPQISLRLPRSSSKIASCHPNCVGAIVRWLCRRGARPACMSLTAVARDACSPRRLPPTRVCLGTASRGAPAVMDSVSTRLCASATSEASPAPSGRWPGEPKCRAHGPVPSARPCGAAHRSQGTNAPWGAIRTGS
jgi:hypothetical protein